MENKDIEEYIRKGNYLEVIKVLKKELKNEPNNTYYLLQLIAAYTLSNREEELKELAKDLILKYPDTANTQSLLAYAIALDDLDKAEKEALRALITDKNSILAHFVLGYIYSSLGKFEEAINELSLVNETFPENVFILRILGTAYFNKGELKEAIKIFSKIIELAPHNIFGYNDLANCYANKNDFQKGLQVWENGIKKNPNNSLFYLYLGNYYWDVLEDYDKTQEQYEKALKISPNSSWIYQYLGWTFKNEIKDLGRAEFYFNKAIELEPNDLIKYNDLAEVYKDMKDFLSGVKVWELAIANNPNKAEAYIYLGDYYWHNLKDYKKAHQCYLKAVKISPKLAWGYRNLGWSYREKVNRNYKKALECSLKAVELAPHDPYNYRVLGYNYNTLKQRDKAIEALHKAIRLGDEHYDTHQLYALLNLKEYKIKNDISTKNQAIDSFIDLYKLALRQGKSVKFAIKHLLLLGLTPKQIRGLNLEIR